MVSNTGGAIMDMEKPKRNGKVSSSDMVWPIHAPVNKIGLGLFYISFKGLF